MKTFSTIVLAGGYGTRLGELGKKMAKPLLKLGRKSLLDRVLEKVRETNPAAPIYVLASSRFLDQYAAWLAESHAENLQLVNNQEPGQSVCPDILANIALTINRHGISSDLLVIGGDNVFDFSLAPFVTFAQKRGASAVIVDAKSSAEARRFSVVQLQKDGKLISLVEKPKRPLSTLVTTCIYWFPASTLKSFDEFVGAQPAAESFGQFMQWLVKRQPVYGYVAKDAWFDVGTLDVYHALQQRYATSNR
jgi:glucose-1-phosphate thymidylyltransferase